MNVNIEEQYWIPVVLGTVAIALAAIAQTSLAMASAAIGAISIAIGVYNYWTFGP